MLNIKDLNAFYGKSHILRGVNLNVEKGAELFTKTLNDLIW